MIGYISAQCNRIGYSSVMYWDRVYFGNVLRYGIAR